MPEWARVVLALAPIAGVIACFLSAELNRYHWRASVRREQIFADGWVEVSRALETADLEGAVGVANQTATLLRNELRQQEAHRFEPLRFWRLPPRPGEPWG